MLSFVVISLNPLQLNAVFDRVVWNFVICLQLYVALLTQNFTKMWHCRQSYENVHRCYFFGHVAGYLYNRLRFVTSCLKMNQKRNAKVPVLKCWKMFYPEYYNTASKLTRSFTSIQDSRRDDHYLNSQKRKYSNVFCLCIGLRVYLR